MESAFGQDFSGVRVHTDSKAGSLSENLHARAFTVGRDIAFASGEYRPGTLIGDALIAHELAHVVQQGGSVSSTMQKGETESGSLEEDADTSAVGAMASLWGGIKGGIANIARNAMPRLRSGLKLQRCEDSIKQPEPAIGPIANYDSFSNPDGSIPPDKEMALLAMIKNWEQLEQVYADAAKGNKRSIRIVQKIEDDFSKIGTLVAEKENQPDCLIPAYRELKGAFTEGCIANWSSLDYLRKDKPSGIRIRTIIGETYEKRARELGIQNEIIINGLNLLFAGMVLKGALGGVAGES
jgi:hypothetical protein